MPTSTITGTIIDGAGTPVAGVVVYARLRPYSGTRLSTGSTVANPPSTTTNGSGVYSFVLEQQANIAPAGSWWELEEDTSDLQGGRSVKTISVGPNSATVAQSEVTPLALLGPSALTQAQGDLRYLALGGPAHTSLDFYVDTVNGNEGLGFGVFAALGVNNGCTAFGHQAATHLTTGVQSTAIGCQALYNANTGGGNTAVGYQAMFSQTDEYDNTAVGHQALYSNSTDGVLPGVANTAVGMQAAFGNVIGQHITAIGQAALFNGNADDNTAVGVECMYGHNGVITGMNNTAMGEATLRAINTGQGNTAIGQFSLGDLTSGSANTALGLSSGVTGTEDFATITGSYNTFIGQLTGQTSATQINYSTCLGWRTLCAADGGVALGVDHLGNSAVSTVQDEMALGTSNHHAIVAGNASIGGAGKSVAFFGATAIPQPTAGGNTTYADSGATAVHTAGTFTGNDGTTGYTIGDIVRALKTLGLIAL